MEVTERIVYDIKNISAKERGTLIHALKDLKEKNGFDSVKEDCENVISKLELKS